MKTVVALLVSFAVVATSYAQNAFPSSGNVGIGTTSPGTRKLNVQSPDSANDVGVEIGLGRTVGTNYGLIVGASGSGADLNQGILATARNGTSNYGLRIYNVLSAPSNYALYSDSPAQSYFQGNVGIGTQSPSQKLTVTDSLAITNIGGVQRLLMGNQDSGGVNKPSIISSGNANIEIGYGNSWSDNGGAFTSTAHFDATGNVGIGTTSPGTRKLNVQSPDSANDVGVEIGLGRTVGTNYGLIVGASGSGADLNQGILATARNGTSNYGLRIYNVLSAPSNYALYSDSPAQSYFQGNVGIGTSTPSHKLSVNGTVRAKEVIVDTGWSDYVFAKGYHLAALSEVEQHIQTQGHLPGVPSAQEVAEKGVSLGDMQAVLLAKIEELTLHQIQQEKRLDTQAQRLEFLERENAELRTSH